MVTTYRDSDPPSAPAGPTAKAAGSAALDLSWNPSYDNVGVAGYDVYLNGSSVDTTKATSYEFSGLTCGTTYTVVVTACGIPRLCRS